MSERRLNREPSGITVGHPVNVHSGVVYTAWHDFELAGSTPIVWRRFYSTANEETGALGRGWSNPYFGVIRMRDQFAVLTGNEAHEHAFPLPGPESPSGLPGHSWQLHRTADYEFVLLDSELRQWKSYVWSPASNSFRLTHIFDFAGNAVTLVRDEQERLLSIEQPACARAVALHYNAQGLIASVDLVADGRELRLVTYEYDARANLTAAFDAAGAAIRYAWDERDRLIRETNHTGGSFYFQYDAEDRCIRTVGNGGYMDRLLEYNVAKRATYITDATGQRTSYHFAPNGSLERYVNALGRVTEYKAAPGMAQTILSNGGLIHREYDDRGLLTTITDPLGKSTLYEYDSLGQQTAKVDPAGNRWTRMYDERGFLIGTLDPVGSEWRFERGPGGEVVREVDPQGRVTERRYGAGMRWQEFDNGLLRTRWEYDARGLLTRWSDATGVVEVFERDPVGRITAIVGADGSVVRYIYDDAGRLIGSQQPNGATWSFVLDAFGSLLETIQPDGASVRVRYDNEGRRLSVINERGDELQNAYAPDGSLVARRFFDGRVENYEYNGVGHLVAFVRSDGTVLRREFDRGRNMTLEYVEPSADSGPNLEVPAYRAQFSYNWRGRVVKASTPAGEIEFVYDASGQLIAERQNDLDIAYSYDASGRLIMRKVSSGIAGGLRFTYDPAGRSATIEDAQGIVQSLAYDNAGRMVRRIMRGGFTESLDWTARERITRQSVMWGGSEIIARRYDYSPADQLTRMDDQQRGRFRWRYDERLRLVEAARNGVPSSYFVWDETGDLIADHLHTLTYDPGSRLRRRANTHYTHDANGNVASKLTEDGGLTRYYYDGKGRLARVVLSDGRVWEYGYNAVGRRLYKRGPEGETRFVWSNRTLAAVIEPNGNCVELLIGSSGHQPAAQWHNGQVQHFVCDAIGRPLEILDADAGIIWSGDHSPWGKLLREAGAARAGSDLRFPGQFEDRETGLFYNYQRYYDPEQTRYLTPDPIGLQGGLKLYDYPRDPLNWIDPIGLKCKNPKLIKSDPKNGIEIHQHDDGSLVITADARKGFCTPKPGGLRDTVHTASENAIDGPEAHLGKDGRLIVMEGTHRSAAASRGAQIPPDDHDPGLGGVPGKPGFMRYAYSPQYDDDQEGTPLQDLEFPPNYPHQLPPKPTP